jgi:nucleotide-binding universal stress UspA family protein
MNRNKTNTELERGRPVVVALLGDDIDAGPAREGAALARLNGSSLVAVHVVAPSDPRVPLSLGPLSCLGPYHLPERLPDERLDQVCQVAREAGVEAQRVLLAAADPAAAVGDVARRHDAAAVVLEPPRFGFHAARRMRWLVRRVRRLSRAPVFLVGGMTPARF